MNRFIILCLLGYFTTQNTTNIIVDATEEFEILFEQTTRPQQMTADQEEMAVVMVNFANIIGNFFNIMNNKEDVEMIGNSVSNILNSLVNIGVQASKSLNTPLQLNDSIDIMVELIKKYFKNLDEQSAQRLKNALLKAAQKELNK